MSKFSFQNTVAELLAAPEVVDIIKELFPEVLTNPLIEMAKPFRLCDALPYLGSMISHDKIEIFRERLEAIE